MIRKNISLIVVQSRYAPYNKFIKKRTIWNKIQIVKIAFATTPQFFLFFPFFDPTNNGLKRFSMLD
jgi:hypothetical protein